MIENPSRQLIAVVLVAVAALVSALWDKPSLGLDLSGGTQLIYELDIEGAKKQGLVDKDVPNTQIMQETLAIIGERIDPTGTIDAGITPRGEFGFMIELPQVGETQSEILKRQIETLGRLEMRLLATDVYNADGARFDDLAGEKKRLEDWLAQDDHREKLAQYPERIDLFNNLSSDDGGRLNQENLWWYPRKIFRDYREPGRWDFSFGIEPTLADAYGVAAFEALEHQGTPPDAVDGQEPFLVEFLPVNMHADHFEGEDMNAPGVRSGTDTESGLPCVFYEIAAGRKSDYADYSGDNIGQRSAIVLNGVIRSAPTFQGRIYGVGRITGGFTTQEAADLAKVIKTGSLQVKPEFVSGQTIGAKLGERSIRLGLISILVGGLLVLVFILAYYRLAGLIAFTAIALNLLLIYGVVQFIDATITLPGIAGLVLTIGMAVDANILIYERIREELKKGKEILQAIRTGFDRAMVTILDANITTFIAGVVLYNVGVGPVRGFAVTLMVGIMTSVFTALVVTRLLFHYLLDRKILKEFAVASWFTGLSFDFVKLGRPAFIGSIAVILLGLGYMTTVRSDVMLGLDFTGGASMEVRLAEGLTERELRDRMAMDEAFRNEYPDPLINRLGDVEDGKARSYSVKLKLTEEQRARLDELKTAAKERGEVFEPPFKQKLLDNPNIPLVQKAFSDVANQKLPSGNLGVLTLHFAEPVVLADIEARLNEVASNVTFAYEGDPPETDTDIPIEFSVRANATEAEITNLVAESLKGISVELSNPIPSAEVIGSRMVGELRTAAIGAMVLSLFLIVMYIRLRFHEYKYGLAAVAALIHDVIVSLCLVVLFNSLGLVNAELDLPMIAAFLTIIGYSINDTIVIFDRVRENLSEKKRLGDTRETFAQLLNRSINQTLSRTILTSGTTLFVVLAVFVVNRGSGSGLEGFAFAMILGIFSGTYSTMFIASPLVLWLRNREQPGSGGDDEKLVAQAADSKVAVKSA